MADWSSPTMGVPNAFLPQSLQSFGVLGGPQPQTGMPASTGDQLMALAKSINGTGTAPAAAPGGGMAAAIQKLMNPAAPAPAVPADGAMQATIGPGAAPPAAAPYTPKAGLPPGGLLGLMGGNSPQGLAGLLQHLTSPQAPAGAPLAGAMPQAGMLGAGQPGSPFAGPVQPPAAAPQLPMDINPMNQF